MEGRRDVRPKRGKPVPRLLTRSQATRLLQRHPLPLHLPLRRPTRPFRIDAYRASLLRIFRTASSVSIQAGVDGRFSVNEVKQTSWAGSGLVPAAVTSTGQP